MSLGTIHHFGQRTHPQWEAPRIDWTTLFLDGVIALHGLFIIYVTAGGLLTWRWPTSAYFHLPLCGWAVLISLFQWRCPLTYVENWLRRKRELPALDRGFIDYYLTPIIYPGQMSSHYFVGLGIALLVINGAIYARTYHTYSPELPSLLD